jgi:hypothetical protein
VPMPKEVLPEIEPGRFLRDTFEYSRCGLDAKN